MTAFGRYDCNLLLFGDFSRLIWLVLFLEIRLSELIYLSFFGFSSQFKCLPITKRYVFNKSNIGLLKAASLDSGVLLPIKQT